MADPADRPYFRPVTDGGPGARRIADGWATFDTVEVLRRGHVPERLPVEAALALWPEAEGVIGRITAPRPALAGVDFVRPRVMGVVNITPDSFSDGGVLGDAGAAVEHGLSLAEAGADILDIGGESTRPGAEPVPIEAEIARVLPVIEGIVRAGCAVPISIDTRKGAVAQAALAAGASVVNDVSAMTYDPAIARAAAGADGLCLMHALGDPRTMQQNPVYDDVLLDIYDYLEARVAVAGTAGIDRGRIIVDPGIGFGKTVDHNLALIRGLALFQGLGANVLLGVSRKGFIGRLAGEPVAARRAPGSIAAGLAGLATGCQILRVHDVAETVQALRVWQALSEGS